MHSIVVPAFPDAVSPTRTVCLPGACHTARDFLAAGFPEAPGLAYWQPVELAETDEERRIWRHIKTGRAGGHDWCTWTTLWESFLESRFT